VKEQGECQRPLARLPFLDALPFFGSRETKGDPIVKGEILSQPLVSKNFIFADEWLGSELP